MNCTKNMRTRIKICGISDELALKAAIEAGADAVGLMLYEKSRRFVDLERAKKLSLKTPAFVDVVAVLVNPETDFVYQVIDSIRPQYLQFHGDETAAFCKQFDYPYIKAIGMQAKTDLFLVCEEFNSAKALLVDTYSKDAYGGVGETFNWDMLVSQMEKVNLPIMLAGGLQRDNVDNAIKTVRPYALDVSSGVEHNGIKDSGKIHDFCCQVRLADSRNLFKEVG